MAWHGWRSEVWLGGDSLLVFYFLYDLNDDRPVKLCKFCSGLKLISQVRQCVNYKELATIVDVVHIADLK